MGDEAIAPEEELVEEAPKETELEPKEGETLPEEEGEKKPEDAPQLVVVREGKEGSQPDTQVEINRIIGKKNRKYKEKVKEADGKTAEAEERYRLKDEENKLLRLHNDQLKAATVETKRPDPKNFDLGIDDPQYEQAQTSYTEKLIAQEVQKQTANLKPAQDHAPYNPEFERKERKHFEKALELTPDFESLHERVVDSLGNDIVDKIVDVFDDSHVLVAYLGTEANKGDLDRFTSLLESDPVKATADLGLLLGELKVRPKAKSQPTPTPDEELEGGTTSSSQEIERKLDKLNEKVQAGDTSAMKKILEIKRQERDKAGVT